MADWLNYDIGRLHAAAADVRHLSRRLSYQKLEHLREAKRWVDKALEKAEEYEREAVTREA